VADCNSSARSLPVMQCFRGPLVLSVESHHPWERRCEAVGAHSCWSGHRVAAPAVVLVASLCCATSASALDVDLQSASSYYAAHPVVRQRGSQQSSSIADATATLAAAREAEDAADYGRALQLYTQVCDKHRDLALVHRARLARALLLFQLDQREEAVLELDDEVVDVGFGNADVRAALAVALHATRPAQLGRAEAEWETATRFAPKFADEQWVRDTKRWPPKLMTCLHQWLRLA
jgi:predicted negative regulator of RcsB-dependent stress response